MFKATNAIQKHVISADGTKIYADAIGNPSNPALVFVHGFSSSGAIFNDIFESPEYTKDFFLVRYDTRGHGRTGKPNDAEGYLSHKYAEDFAAVLKAFNAKKPILVGWSMGGTVLADVAAHLPPDTLSGSVSLAGSPFLGPALHDATTAAFRDLQTISVDDPITAQHSILAANRLLLLRDRNPSTNFFEETFKANEAGADFLDENPDLFWETRCALLGMAAHMSPTHRLLAATRTQDTAKLFELAGKGFPLLIIYGTHDGYMSGEKVVDGIRPFFTNLDIKAIERGSHVPFLESPQEVMEAISRFAKRILSV